MIAKKVRVTHYPGPHFNYIRNKVILSLNEHLKTSKLTNEEINELGKDLTEINEVAFPWRVTCANVTEARKLIELRTGNTYSDQGVRFAAEGKPYTDVIGNGLDHEFANDFLVIYLDDIEDLNR